MGRSRLTRLLFGLLLVPIAVLVVVQPVMAIPYGGCSYGASTAKDCPGSDTPVTVTQPPPAGQGFFDKLDKYERIIFGGLTALALSQFFIIFFRGNQKKKEDQPPGASLPQPPAG